MRLRAFVAFAILAALVGGLVGHHDRHEPAFERSAEAILVASAATHAGAAAHVEASDTEAHAACQACLLQRQRSLAVPIAAEVGAVAATSERFARIAFESPSSRPARYERGRAPPIA
jgi:hypothetical protein